jgi:hypothetical protein
MCKPGAYNIFVTFISHADRVAQHTNALRHMLSTPHSPEVMHGSLGDLGFRETLNNASRFTWGENFNEQNIVPHVTSVQRKTFLSLF